MKTLALLLLLTSAAVGQDWGKPGIDPNMPIFGPQKYRMQSDTMTYAVPSVGSSIVELLYWWDRYSAECYADSTRTLMDVIRRQKGIVSYPCSSDGNEIDPGFSPVWVGHRFEYLHRTPTFEGFIAWLRRHK